MKKYFYIATIAAFMLSGCEDFLDTENYTKKNTGNFPETVEDIDMMLQDLILKKIVICNGWMLLKRIFCLLRLN